MKSSLLDGPVQRQMILMKLVHAMNNRPDFGLKFDNDPDGKVRQWLSHVRALIDRVSIEKSVRFNSTHYSLGTYWQPTIRSLQIIVNDAIEEVRLELELYQDDQIGVIYEADESHRFKSDILQILQSAETEVFLVDPYFDAVTFSLLFENHANFKIRVLCSQYFEAVIRFAASFKLEHSRLAEVKKSKLIHDRVIFIDDECWLVGASIKDAGIKPTYLMPISPALGLAKKQIYDDMWASLP